MKVTYMLSQKYGVVVLQCCVNTPVKHKKGDTNNLTQIRRKA